MFALANAILFLSVETVVVKVSALVCTIFPLIDLNP
jgi:hypothetical protein